MQTNHNEVKSGLLIVTAAVGLVALLFGAGSYHFFSETYPVQIRFNYISGLEVSAPVHFAGHLVGKVTGIEILGKKNGQILVHAAISKQVVLRQDSQAYIDMMGFLGEKFLELTPGSHDTPVLAEGAILQGTEPLALNEIMQKGTAVAEELQKTTVALQGLISNLDDLIGENREQIKGIMMNADTASGNLRDMTLDLKYHPWKILRKGKEKNLETGKYLDDEESEDEDNNTSKLKKR